MTLVSKAAESAGKSLILFFDQFEQFFVHRQQKTDRESFLNGLAAWFKHPDPPAVKILFSIRSDLYHNLVEIQQALGYSPSPQEIFPLAKFTPTEATRILGAIAAIENLNFEESFIREVAKYLCKINLTFGEGRQKACMQEAKDFNLKSKI